jgi:hypothetical protein
MMDDIYATTVPLPQDVELTMTMLETAYKKIKETSPVIHTSREALPMFDKVLGNERFRFRLQVSDIFPIGDIIGVMTTPIDSLKLPFMSPEEVAKHIVLIKK